MDHAASRSSQVRTARFVAACHYIEQNLLQQSLTPALVAATLSISVRQLHMLFEPTGRSFSRFVLDKRLETACRQLIDHPHRRVVDIVPACGIRSATVFYRAFRDAYGMSPRQYRQARAALDTCASSAGPAP